jgi:hypothetical protein
MYIVHHIKLGAYLCLIEDKKARVISRYVNLVMTILQLIFDNVHTRLSLCEPCDHYPYRYLFMFMLDCPLCEPCDHYPFTLDICSCLC